MQQVQEDDLQHLEVKTTTPKLSANQIVDVVFVSFI